MTYLKAWLFCAIVTIVLCFFIGIPFGVVLGVSLGLLEVAKENARVVAQILGFSSVRL